tara:strand:- start:26 stop:538 length:513 start_codon:yes stop_codon:yes gene_type:complete
VSEAKAMQAALYPGSFDPITYGHLYIIERARDMGIFSEITVLLAVNPNKALLFPTEENMELIRQATGQWSDVKVDSTEGLVTDYARRHDVRVAIRGLRGVTDFENEFSMALTNRDLSPQFDTLFLMTRSDYMYLSSTLVRQVAQMGGAVEQFVPECVAAKLREKFGRGVG